MNKSSFFLNAIPRREKEPRLCSFTLTRYFHLIGRINGVGGDTSRRGHGRRDSREGSG